MIRMNKERVKTFILAILILTSFIQVGILWNYQVHGFPFNFITAVFMGSGSETSNITDKERAQYFGPTKILVSNGDTYWEINKNKDSATYKTLWNDAMLYINYIGESTGKLGKPVNKVSFSKESWGDIVANKSIVFDFKQGIKFSHLIWLINGKVTTPNEPANINKIAISPWEDVNSSNMTVYLRDDEYIYKYILKQMPNGLTREGYNNNVIKKLLEDTNNRSFNIFSQAIPNAEKMPFSINPDILVNFLGPKYYFYQNISPSVPVLLEFNKQNILELENIILGNEKDTYDSIIDSDKVVFRNLNNIYRFYNDGLFEYKYLSISKDTNKGSMGDAYKNAYHFINDKDKRRLLNGTKAEYYLSSVKEENDGYTFTFDCRINDYPIFFNYEINDKQKKVLNNAVTIKSNGERVTNCLWILNIIDQAADVNQYNTNIGDFLDDFFNNYAYLKSKNDFSIYDISIGYEIKKSTSIRSIEPVWLINSNNGDFVLTMKKK